MAKPDKAIQVRLPGELAEQITELAEREFRSLNGEILYLLQRGLEAERRIMRNLEELGDEKRRTPRVAARV